MQTLQSVGTAVPARLVVDRVRLYIAEVMRWITANQSHVLDVQTQYTDALEDWVKSVFVRGIEDAIAARDAWHHDKVNSLIALFPVYSVSQVLIATTAPYSYNR